MPRLQNPSRSPRPAVATKVLIHHPNVLFELGYAIGKNKRIWLIFDTSYPQAKQQWDQLRILSTLGYRWYTNSKDISQRFHDDQPHNDLRSTILDTNIKPTLRGGVTDSILYLKSKHDNEASVQMTAKLETSGYRLITDDPRESSSQSLTWYGQRVFGSAGIVCHLASPDREGSGTINARYAFVAGLAYALEKPLLILVEGDHLNPIDYRDIAHSYKTSGVASSYLANWITLLKSTKKDVDPAAFNPVRVLTNKDLRSLNFGDYIAENEGDTLPNYFIETAAFKEALRGQHTIFVGRKGMGKSANLLTLETKQNERPKTLVCAIKPVAYELEAVVRLMTSFREKDAKGYAVETLWKLLIYTEILNISCAKLKELKPIQAWSSDDHLLYDYVNKSYPEITEAFSIRMERYVDRLLKTAGVNYSTTEDSRIAISESLHKGDLKDIKKYLKIAIGQCDRIAVLVDNLDKAWDNEVDIPAYADVTLGLLGTASRLGDDFKSGDIVGKSVELSLAIFLRADIFSQISRFAREPDKIRYFRMEWADRDLLARVIGERYKASHKGVEPEKMWSRHFCPTVNGIKTQEYFLKFAMPRPRDLLFFVKAAVDTAINRQHSIVEEDDVTEAERLYSQFAYDTLAVENGTVVPDFQNVLYEFLAGEAELTRDDVVKALSRGKLPSETIPSVIEHLCRLNFLGIEVRQDVYRWPEDSADYQKCVALARRLTELRNFDFRYKINYPFWTYLELVTTRHN